MTQGDPTLTRQGGTAGRRALVALSGGVDSAVAAGLLVESGADVVAAFMRNGVSGRAGARSCCALSDARDARAVASRLAIPFYAIDLAQPFATLMDEFAADYASGLTPNPCIVCNNRLKFGELMRLADDLGCDTVVTGHYARLDQGRLRRAADRNKDQSYLLHGLDADQRRRARFPLGGLLKAQVRTEARRLGLAVADKPDSADICFVPGGDYRAVVEQRLGHLGARGEVRDPEGRVLARHAGVAGFTVGQRRGLGVALGAPAFVHAIDPGDGTVRVGPAAALERDTCRLSGVSWHAGGAPGGLVTVQLRHHHVPEPVGVTDLGDGQALLRFARPSRAVTPGQYAVLYDGDLVLGGGRVTREAGA